jgi:P2 family phage contractile tail tube protein
MAVALLPLQINNYSVWKDGWRFLGMADCTLPKLDNLTDEYKAAGYGGSTNYPVQSHYGDWELIMNFHAITDQSLELMRQQSMNVQLLAGIEYQDPATHMVNIGGWRFSLIILPKTFDLGKLEVGAKQTVAIGAACTYIKASYNGKLMFEKDKVNIVDSVLGTDYAAPIRSAIGISN